MLKYGFHLISIKFVSILFYSFQYIFNTSYINNALQMQRIKAREDFRRLREVVDHHAWGELPPTVVNAFYEPSTNSICNVYILHSTVVICLLFFL